MTQAFDRIQLKDVLNTLYENQVDNKIVELVKEMNTENTTRIRTEYGLSEEIPIKAGVRQGDSLSSVLFSMIMDKIMQNVKRTGEGYWLGNTEMRMVCYADDVVLMAEDKDNLQ